MKMNAVVAGVGMTHFGKHLDKGLKALGALAINAAVADAGIKLSDIQAAYMGNAAAGLITGQESIRGQVVLRGMGVGKIPVINVENACASASTAFHEACAMVSAGAYDIVLATGIEKLYHEDKQVSFRAFTGAVDTEMMAQIMANLRPNAAKPSAAPKADGGAPAGGGEKRSMFMDIYAAAARTHMQAFGTTARQFAAVSAKNSFHGSLNERAQFRELLTIEEVLSAPMIADPLTRPMCSPIGDGAAAVIVMSEKKARELGISKPVRVLSVVLRSGWDRGYNEDGLTETCSKEAYAQAGIGPSDLSAVELHDASAPAEVTAAEGLGLCKKGEGGILAESGASRLGGRIPINCSGGLLRKGHPIGATGLAQIVELSEQIQGRSGKRQVEGARLGLAHNGGGNIGIDAAATVVTILGA
jgi:acetyl-CoA acetyltransferase